MKSVLKKVKGKAKKIKETIGKMKHEHGEEHHRNDEEEEEEGYSKEEEKEEDPEVHGGPSMPNPSPLFEVGCLITGFRG